MLEYICFLHGRCLHRPLHFPLAGVLHRSVHFHVNVEFRLVGEDTDHGINVEFRLVGEDTDHGINVEFGLVGEDTDHGIKFRLVGEETDHGIKVRGDPDHGKGNNLGVPPWR
jgi:hypothetical protein